MRLGESSRGERGLHRLGSHEEAVAGQQGGERLFARQPDIYLSTACLDRCAHTERSTSVIFSSPEISREVSGENKKKKNTKELNEIKGIILMQII